LLLRVLILDKGLLSTAILPFFGLELECGLAGDNGHFFLA
jgi:hypothetical protein